MKIILRNKIIVQDTPLKDLKIIETTMVKDLRGNFIRSYCKQDYDDHGLKVDFVQTNISMNNSKGTIRGMHMQLGEFAEIKLVRCLQGKVLDVVIDLRKNSPDFLKYYSIELSEDNGQALWIPKGFAHGFQTLTDRSTLLYQHSAYYNSDAEFRVSYMEPRVSIIWPLMVTNISDKDLNVKFLDKTWEGVDV